MARGRPKNRGKDFVILLLESPIGKDNGKIYKDNIRYYIKVNIFFLPVVRVLLILDSLHKTFKTLSHGTELQNHPIFLDLVSSG
jgi:hypothetical protein